MTRQYQTYVMRSEMTQTNQRNYATDLIWAGGDKCFREKGVILELHFALLYTILEVYIFNNHKYFIWYNKYWNNFYPK